jgi:hypothetical protein
MYPRYPAVSAAGRFILALQKSCIHKAPLWKRGVRGDLKVTMLRYNKNLKGYSRSLRVNMTERYLRVYRVFLKE